MSHFIGGVLNALWILFLWCGGFLLYAELFLR